MPDIPIDSPGIAPHQIQPPNDSGPRYQSYLLRLWQEAPGSERRALLQEVLSGESRRFSSLEDLLAYLGGSPEPPHEGDDAGSPG